MVPPGELMCTMTAACDFSSRSSASTRLWSLRISPSMLTRAIDPDDVSEAASAGGRDQADGDDRRDRHHDGRDPPERQLATDPAAIDDHVRIERHRISPEIFRTFCILSVTEALSDYINCDAI